MFFILLVSFSKWINIISTSSAISAEIIKILRTVLVRTVRTLGPPEQN